MDFFRWAMTATRRAGAETAASMRRDLPVGCWYARCGLNPGAVAVGVSKLRRARAITSFSTNPRTLPAVIVIAAHHARR